MLRSTLLLSFPFSWRGSFPLVLLRDPFLSSTHQLGIANLLGILAMKGKKFKVVS